MVQINFAQRQVNAKIVYYGPGMSGKTTNLEIVHQRAPSPNRGDLTSISTDGDRTLFFDFMPLDLGTVAGMRTCFQIYTVPGQVYYNSTRKLVLQGVDGVVFVADSSAAMIEENLESMRNLEQNLLEYGKNLATIPLIIQYNKRDLPDAMSVEELNAALNPYNAPAFEAIANTGQGVFPTLKALAARVLETIHTGAKSASNAAPSSGQTGYHAGVLPQSAPTTPSAAPVGAGGPPRGLGQTGFHAAPPLAAQAPAPRVLPHVPTQIAPQVAAPSFAPAPIAAQAAPASLVPPPFGGAAPAAPPSRAPARPLGREAQVAPVPPAGIAMPPMPGAHVPRGVTPAASQPPASIPLQGQPVAQAPARPTAVAFAPQAPAQAPAPGGGPLQMLRPERKAGAAPGPVAVRPRAAAPARAPVGSDVAARRVAPMPTPGATGNRRLVYVGLFVAVALGAGAVIAKIVLKVF